jgi:hypothetical protein
VGDGAASLRGADRKGQSDHDLAGSAENPVAAKTSHARKQ